MQLIDLIKNKTIYKNKYRCHSEAIIISCFFNPQNSPYRLKAFNIFYESIKHLNHSIIECVIGDSEPQLPLSNNIKRVFTKDLLWHKEALLNKIIAELPKKYKYVFWVDADVLFTNLNWLVDGVEELQYNNIIQPFAYCIHLNKGELKPSFDTKSFKFGMYPNEINKKAWKSFCANSQTFLRDSENYNEHGHVGFAWGAKRSILDEVPLYDKALIGGADHIIAHAAAGQIFSNCIAKSFTENIDEIRAWSSKFYNVVQNKIGCVSGDLYHIWHGDIEKRDYFNRVKEFTPISKNITKKDKNGLYIANDDETRDYFKKYYEKREVNSLLDDVATIALMHSFIDESNVNNTPNENPNAGFNGGGAGGNWDSINNIEVLPTQENVRMDDNVITNLSINENKEFEPFS